MKKYLSIGEVSKLKNVSIKSLRYYGELGILPPAYINEESGYRYYSVEQLAIIDLIIVCLDLDIPLKHFKNYVSEYGTIDIAKLYADGESIVTEKIKRLNLSVTFLEGMSKHIERTNKIKRKTESFQQYIPERFFLTSIWIGSLEDYAELSGAYSKLLLQCKILGVTDMCNQGILMMKQEENIIKRVYFEIPYFIENQENLITVKAGDYLCEVIEGEKAMTAQEQNFHDILIIKELIDIKVLPGDRYFEVQKRI